MALKAIVLRRRLDKRNEELNALREKDAEFKTREEELEAAVSEAATEEDEKALEAEIEKFETEKGQHEEEKKRLQSEIDDLEAQLSELESKEPGEPESRGREERSRRTMDRRKFFGLDRQEREAFLAVFGEQAPSLKKETT